MGFARGRVRWRLTLWYAITLTVICVVLSTCVFLFMRTSGMLLLRTQADRDVAQVKVRLEKTGVDTAPDALSVVGDAGGVMLFGTVSALHGERLSASWRAAFPPGLLGRGGPAYRIEQGGNGRHYFLHEATIGVYTVGVAEDIEQIYAIGRKLVLLLWIGFPAALLASLAGGYWLAGRAIAPVAEMARRAREISAENLSARLPVRDRNDEFGQMAVAFNDTLSRLEGAFERMRRFTADASHELRTPLTVIRSVGEHALQQPLDGARQADAIGSMLEEVDRLVRLLDGLLLLTRADADALALNRSAVDVAALVAHATDSLAVLAEEKRQTLVCANRSGAIATIDAATLKQAVYNLVSNAIRYTPAGGAIQVDVTTRAGEVVIEVGDTGPGIAAQHHPHVFERFYRVEPDRSRATGGTGLGLAIARWAVKANGGTIELASEPGRGSVFTIRVPAGVRARG